MSNTYIPNTNVEGQILTPSPATGYVALYLENGETGNGKNMGSVNAGSSNTGSVFAVGLGGINRAFKNALRKAGQNFAAYQSIHQNLFNQAGTGLQATESNFAATDPVKFSMIQKPDPAFNLPGYDGIVFIDVFNTAQVPNANSLNYGMFYVVPPNFGNYPDISSFLNAVQATNITLVNALSSYNTKFAVTGNTLGLMPVNNIRMCLFSGSIYRGSASVDDVAENNVKGLEIGLTNPANKNNGIELVEFEFAEAAPWLETK